MIEIEHLYEEDDGDTIIFWSRGHVDKAAFLAALVRDEELVAEMTDIRHEYMHGVPHWDYGRVMYFRGEPGRGWQAVTCVDRGRCRWFDEEGECG